jgi:hypothetical protein
MESHEQKLKTTVFFVEATNFERHSLWRDYHEETKWEDDTSGVMIEVGRMSKAKPIWVSFNFAKIFGKRICFYYTSGRYNDSELVEKWIEKNYPLKWDNGTRRAMTDANNFHHAVDRCQNG